MMFIILTLIIAVAAFNLVSTLVMTVTDKQADIAILRTLGSSPRSIMKIFMIQGALVGLIGTAHRRRLRRAGRAEYRRDRPVYRTPAGSAVLAKDIYLISTCRPTCAGRTWRRSAAWPWSLAFVATLYPSLAASRVKPAEALRYE